MANYVLFDFIQSDKLKILALCNLCNKVVNSNFIFKQIRTFRSCNLHCAMCITTAALRWGHFELPNSVFFYRSTTSFCNSTRFWNIQSLQSYTTLLTNKDIYYINVNTIIDSYLSTSALAFISKIPVFASVSFVYYALRVTWTGKAFLLPYLVLK